jgi:osmoprotectant transport system substrate-binding protein
MSVPGEGQTRRRDLLRALIAAGVLACAGCRSDQRAEAPTPEPGSAVVVASFSFPESRVLAEIYAQALEHAGVTVRRELNLGPRELVLPALQQGLVDVVPEYLGSAFSSVSPGARVDVRDAAAVRSALDRSLTRWGLRVLQPAAASNQNGLVVTRATAARLGLRTVSDLRGKAKRLTLGAPPECPARAYCLPGLRDVYGLRFGHFMPFETQTQRVTALEQQVIDVALLFTTDGHLATGELVLLVDDRRLQPAENVVPIVSSRAVERHGDRVARALTAVSARLDSASLIFVNWRVSVAGKDIVGEARGWLRRHELVTLPA